MMNGFIPPGYRLFTEAREEIGADALRHALSAGELESYRYDDGTGELRRISANEWLGRRGAEQLMGDGKGRPWTNEMLLVKAQQAQKHPAPVPKNKGGAPTKYDWESALIFASKFIHDNGLPNSTGDLVRAVQDWFAERDQHPSSSLVRERVSRLYLEFRATET